MYDCWLIIDVEQLFILEVTEQTVRGRVGIIKCKRQQTETGLRSTN